MKIVTSNQLQYWRNLETERANRENEGISWANHGVNRMNAFTNSRNADTMWWKAKADAQIRTGELELGWAKHNLEQSKHDLDILKFNTTPGGAAWALGDDAWSTYQHQITSQVAANTYDAWITPIGKTVKTIGDISDIVTQISGAIATAGSGSQQLTWFQ